MPNLPPSPRVPLPKRARLGDPVGRTGNFQDPFAGRRAPQAERGAGSGARDLSSVVTGGGGVATAQPSADRQTGNGKAVVDKLMAVEARIKDLEREYKADLELIEQEVKDLQDEVADANRRCNDMAATVQTMQLEINGLREQVENSAGAGGDGDGGDDDGNGGLGSGRNNILAATVRRTMLGLMQLPSSKDLPHPVNEYSAPAFYLIEGEYRFLRPHWELDWEDNERAWVMDVAAKVQSNGAQWNRLARAEDLRKLPLATIAKAIQATFETWKARYKMSKETAKKQAAERRAHRHNQRRGKKVAVRVQHRESVPELTNPEFNFLFTTKYTSSDDSDIGADVSAIDPETEEEDDDDSEAQAALLLKRKKPASVLVSRPPTYRVDKIEGLLVELHTNIAKKTGSAAPSRGEPKDIPLPKLRANKKRPPVRIPRSMVDPEWLRTHDEYDKPSLMAAEDEDRAGGGERGADEDEGNAADTE